MNGLVKRSTMPAMILPTIDVDENAMTPDSTIPNNPMTWLRVLSATGRAKLTAKKLSTYNNNKMSFRDN